MTDAFGVERPDLISKNFVNDAWKRGKKAHKDTQRGYVKRFGRKPTLIESAVKGYMKDEEGNKQYLTHQGRKHQKKKLKESK